ncbi:LysM peptidoglycan-binding domain-containing protein [Natronospora cellulosivora (SeqCode)]
MKKIALISMLTLFIFSQSLMAMQVHRVIEGETLYSIARDHGVLVNELLHTNRYMQSENVFPEQVLIIPSETVYYVRPGDDLFQISEKVGLSIEDLLILNEISNPDRIYPGQILKIIEDNFVLNTTVTHYKVQPGDTLYSISMRLGASINTLIHLNSVEDVKNLEVGQVLIVPEYTFTEMRELYPEHFFIKGRTNSRKVALTFDDGPDEIYTPGVLDVLEEFDVPGTFFYMGRRAEMLPEVVERTVEENHIIANHSWSHPALSNISDLRIYDEVMDTENILAEITGLRTALIRPPYGMVSQRVLEQLKEMDYRTINWDVDSIDWRDRNVDQILINTIPDIREDSIILFHTAGGVNQSLSATVEVLPELIHTLQVHGFEFVTVDEILDIPAYK